jgi:peptidoglycan/LPS O-acetylase OafA/YrhL
MDRWLGEISYPLFLIHGPAIVGTQALINASGADLRFDVDLAILATVSIAAAHVLVLFVERPVMAWRRRLWPSAPAAPAPVPA